jgi:hypothetical protein
MKVRHSRTGFSVSVSGGSKIGIKLNVRLYFSQVQFEYPVEVSTKDFQKFRTMAQGGSLLLKKGFGNHRSVDIWYLKNKNI